MNDLSRKTFQTASDGPKLVFSFAPSLDDLTERQRLLRLKTLNACGTDTCHPEAQSGYKVAVKTSGMLGSNTIAAILFIYQASIRKMNHFYPVVVENAQLPNALAQYFMIFDDAKKKVFDFTPAIISGGFANYRPDIQLAVLRAAVSDPTLEQRVAAGLKAMNIAEDPQIAIQIFIDRFHLCFKELDPKEAFGNA